MEFRILGRLEVVDEGRVVPVDRQRARAVLAFLLLHANEPVSGERLIDEVWGPEPPKSAAASLQNYVSHLRKALGRDVLVTEPGGYVLRVDPERFDLARFERLVADARRVKEPGDRAERLRAALALWRGPPLEDLAFESFAQSAIRRLEEQRLDALEERIDADLACGQGAELVAELEGLIEEQPLRERLRGQLMRAFYAAGRQADALDAYRDARRVLRDELGLDPSDELRQLEQAILRHDPSLGPAPREAAPRPDSRRTVTVLFCDLVESTRLARELDPEAYRALMSRYLEAVRGAIERHGGVVEKFIGDAVMAVFGAPELHEDDAFRAVRAAVDARSAVAELAEAVAAEWDVQLEVGIAVNTGEVVVVSAGPDLTVTGAAVSLASHLEEEAPDGAIVLGDETYRLVRNAVRAERIELGEGLEAWRLDELLGETPPVARHEDASLVGRQKELRRLLAAYDAACAERHCRVVTLVGEAGIGKTRLGRELVASVRDGAQVLVGRCVSYGEGATYLPLREIVNQAAPEPTAAGIATLLRGEEDGEQVAQRVAELTGLAEGPAAPGEAFWAVRRFVEALARERPLLLALDDVHWAEPTLLDLVEYLGEWAEGPILVLCLSRPELLESRPGWGGPTSTGFVVELEPLPADESAELLAQLAEEPLAEEIRERIVEQSGGNPLFAEQLLALVQEAPEVDVDAAPPSVEALIASRLDRLDARELETIRRAAVVGRRFTRTELEDLAAGEPVEAHLRELEQRRLVRPTPDAEIYRFHHVLVRDVAYRGIPKAERAQLHERAGKSLDRRDDADELVGYHFEQAYRYLTQLARPDEHGRELATSAGERLARAGVRAWKRGDATAAVNLFGRATSLPPTDDPARVDLLCDLGAARWATGDVEAAEAAFQRAVAAARSTGSERHAFRAALDLRNFLVFKEPHTAIDEFLEFASRAIPVFERANDDRSLGRTWLATAYIHGGLDCNYGMSEKAATAALAHYRRADWPIYGCLQNLAAALFYGPAHVPQAIIRCRELLEDAGVGGKANVLVFLAGLHGMRGDFGEARALMLEAADYYRELAWGFQSIASAATVAAEIDVLAGDLDAAEERLRVSCRTLQEMNDRVHLATQAPQLAVILCAQERWTEAEVWVDMGREASAIRDISAQVSWRVARAYVLARQVRFEEAERVAREAVSLAERTDAPGHRAAATLALANVLRASDQSDEGERTLGTAVRIYENKGNIVAARQVQKLASPLTTAS